MKRLCFFVLLLILSASACIPTGAFGYETEASGWTDVELRALYVQNGMRLSSEINPTFEAAWPTFAVPEAGGVQATSNFNMRGFAMSHDGRYSYMSVLHGGGNIVRGMFVMETLTGRITDYRTRFDGDVCDGAAPHFSYPKGVAADTRGYVYIGWTLSDSYNAAYLTVEQQKDDGTLETVAELPVCSLGTPGDPTGVKVGINGVSVAEVNGRMLCYVVTNYDHDALYCFDVTDPKKPVLQKNSGDLPTLVGKQLEEACYLDIAEDGTAYLAITKSDGDGIAVISPDGTTVERFISLNDVYSVELVGNFLLCGMRTSNAVTVLSRKSGKKIAAISTADGHGERITRMQIVQDVLFVCDAGSFENQGNAVYAAALSDRGDVFLKAIVKGQRTGIAEYPFEADAETTSDPATEASADRTTSAETASAELTSTPDVPTENNGGCASNAALLSLLVLPACALLYRKKH